MASKRKARIRECTRKRSYATQQGARSAMRDLIASGRDPGGRPLHTYPCPFCGGWHVGHKPMFGR